MDAPQLTDSYSVVECFDGLQVFFITVDTAAVLPGLRF